MSSGKKFKLVTLGCRTNQYESQAYADQLRALGYREAQNEEVADLCIVNTCTVTASADRDSRAEIRKLARAHAGARLVVTGCLAERKPEEILQIGGVERVISNLQKESLVRTLFPEEEVPEFGIEQFAAHTRPFVKVQDGCNSFCTYCIIPYVRGRSRSREIADVVAEIERLIVNGYKEVVLTGINIGDYEDGTARLADLVRAVDGIPGLKRTRISSIDPDEVDGPLLEAVMGGKTTCPSMHIVLQSGSNAILKRMNRKYTRQIFLESISRLKAANPDFTFTTDVIVGFPGETEQDFEETLAVMREVQFAKVHAFPYSVRERTRAALYPNQVPKDVIQERMGRILREAEQQSFRLRSRFVGREMEVLIEGDGRGGHTANFLPVQFRHSQFQPHDLVTCSLKDNTPEGLHAD